MMVFLAEQAIQVAIASGEGQIFSMKSIGTYANGEQVSEMDFEWSVRVKLGKPKRIDLKI